MRILGYGRLSRDAEESTSIERQREAIEAWALANGHTMVEFVPDVDVSGSIHPEERRELGPWLTDPLKADSYDAIVAYRLDRVSRRLFHTVDMLKWADAHGKTLVSVTEGFDLSTPLGRMFFAIIAVIAEGELEAIRSRARDSFQQLQKVGRWRGGSVPYGYRAVRNPNGDGYVLEPDPETSTIVQEIFTRVAKGEPRLAVAADLTKRGLVTPQGKKGWTGPSIKVMVTRKAALGQIESKQDGLLVLLRDEHGLPLQRADPIVTTELWKQANEAVRDAARPLKRARQTAPLLRLVYCAKCDEPLYRFSNGHSKDFFYRCSGKTVRYNACTSTPVPAEGLHRYVEDLFLDEVGDAPRRERVFVPGEDNTERMTELREAIRALTERQTNAGPVQAEIIQETITSHETEYAALATVGIRKARYEYRETGETWTAWWKRTTWDERRTVLLNAGISVKVLLERPNRFQPGAWTVNLDLPTSLRESLERL
ncbi:recombinase family protein [Phytomonospora sp. NPDC050363]|uniref:recombinase family protein n=1 Tax=Phytomonospora sp. NPDC050363 TaxID=3155642 RepID=UPI0033C633EA